MGNFPALMSGDRDIRINLAVFGSSLPRICLAWSEYQTIPCESTITSCGIVSGRGGSYSVTITRVALPLGRGRVLSGYCH